MKEFLKSVLKKSSIILSIPVPGNEIFEIGNPTIIINNACETVFRGRYKIPVNRTATVTGTLKIESIEEGVFELVPETIIEEITNQTGGIHSYNIELGNSGRSGSASSYTLRIILDNGNQITRLFQRTAFHSSLYDTNPC